MGFPGSLAGKESACSAGDPGLGRFPGEGNSYPLQYCGLENSMDRGAWQVTVHGVAKSQTQLGEYHFPSLPFSLSPSKGLPKGWGREDLLIIALIVTQYLKTAKQPSL